MLYGNHESDDKVVQIRKKEMGDDLERREVTYHEIGHFLFGFSKMDRSSMDSVLKRILQIKEKNQDTLTLPPADYARGLLLLEEYIVQKFAVSSSQETLGRQYRKHENLRYVPSGDYTFSTYFANSGYGVFESVCDSLIYKKYSSFGQVLHSCLDDKFWMEIFDKYDEVQLMQILGNLGYVHKSVMAYSTDRTIISQSETKKCLQDAAKLISQIPRQYQNNINSHDDSDDWDPML